MDEPLIGVDAESQNSFLDLIDSLNKDMGITIVIVSHDIDVVRRRADKIIGLVNGKVIIENLKDRH
jgi:zinc transport system ATP-binding protein